MNQRELARVCFVALFVAATAPALPTVARAAANAAPPAPETAPGGEKADATAVAAPEHAPHFVSFTLRTGFRWAARTSTGGLDPADLVAALVAGGADSAPEKALLHKLDFGFSARQGGEVRAASYVGGVGLGGFVELMYAEQRVSMLSSFELTQDRYAGTGDSDIVQPWRIVDMRHAQGVLRELGGGLGFYWRIPGVAPVIPVLLGGAEATWISGDRLTKGAGIYGHLGAACEYYVAEWFGLRAELNYFVGGIGAASRVRAKVLSEDRTMENSFRFGFGHGVSVDLGINLW